MKIIGLDIATNTGWCLLEDGLLKDRGTISLNSKMDLSQKLRYFSVELSRVLDKYKPDWAYLEDVFLGMSGAKTLAYLARLNGVAINVCFTYLKDNVKLYQPAYWKKNSFPDLNGSASKWEIQLASCKYFGIQLESSFQTAFMVRQKWYYDEINQAKLNLELKRKLVAKCKAEMTRKRNPVSDSEKDKVKELQSQEELKIIEIKGKLVMLEKDLDKFMDKISIDISAQTGMSSDICDASGIAVCGMKEILV